MGHAFPVLAVFAVMGLAPAAQVCDLLIQACPEVHSGQTVSVPPQVIALDARIPVCRGKVEIPANATQPPISILFVIDHSRSMWGTDPTASRYTVVSDVIRKIHAVAPAAEVGLSIFNSSLVFDVRDNPYFLDVYPGDKDNQYNSVVPLTALNRSFSGGRTGLDTLQAFLSLVLVQQAGLRDHYELVHRTKRREGDHTNIEMGFTGALAAMKASKAAKENRYIIFLSDGESDLSADFVKVLETATPTTFTVYFTDPDQPPAVPKTIADITAKVKASAYSTSNSKSANASTNLPGGELQKILQADIFGGILTFPTQPRNVSVSVGGSTRVSASYDTSAFLFSGRMPLTSGETSIRFDYTNTYLDSAAGMLKDTLLKYTLAVRRDAAAPPLPPGFSMTCREQASLGLFRGGLPVDTVRAADPTLEIRLVPSAGDSCKSCAVAVSPSRSGDRESVPLIRGTAWFGGFFGRAEDSLPKPGDGRLQHLKTDSIILVFTNPENHLDVVRRGYLYLPNPPVKPPDPPDTPIVIIVPPKPVVPALLEMKSINEIARPSEGARAGTNSGWSLVAPQGLVVRPLFPGISCCRILPASPTGADSLAFVGSEIRANRPFRLEAAVFSNLGQLVDKVGFEVPAAEFNKLPLVAPDSSRSLRLLWNNGSLDGALPGTGAYIFRTLVTMAPGTDTSSVALVRASSRLVGLIRSK